MIEPDLMNMSLTELEMKAMIEKGEDINEKLDIYKYYNIDNEDIQEGYDQTRAYSKLSQVYLYNNDDELQTLSRKEVKTEYKRRKILYIRKLNSSDRDDTYEL